MQRFLERIASVWKPHDGQREFLLSTAKTKVLACGRRWGKTDACAVQVLHALTRLGSPVRCFLVAPTLEQARILFERVVDLAEQAKEFLEELSYKLRWSPFPKLIAPNGIVIARSGHRPRSLRGYGATDIVVDEAAYSDDSLIHDVLWPMMATTDGRMTLISTPNGRNGFWKLFQRGLHGGDVWSRQAPSSENPHISRNFLESQRDLMEESRYAVEYEAAFLDREGAVFPMACLERCLVPGFAEAARGPFYVGIDFARVGDFTAVAVLCGTCDEARLVRLERFQEENWENQVDRIEGILADYPQAKIVADATGCGTGPAQSLVRRFPSRVQEYVITTISKTLLVDGLRRLVQRAALRMLPDPVLMRELESFVEVPRPVGPSKYGAATGHDDTVLALALAATSLPKDHGASILSAGNRRY